MVLPSYDDWFRWKPACFLPSFYDFFRLSCDSFDLSRLRAEKRSSSSLNFESNKPLSVFFFRRLCKQQLRTTIMSTTPADTPIIKLSYVKELGSIGAIPMLSSGFLGPIPKICDFSGPFDSISKTM